MPIAWLPIGAAIIGAILGSVGTLIVQMLLQRREIENKKDRIRSGLLLELNHFGEQISAAKDLDDIEWSVALIKELYLTQLTFYDQLEDNVLLLTESELKALVQFYGGIQTGNILLQNHYFPGESLEKSEEWQGYVGDFHSYVESMEEDREIAVEHLRQHLS